MADRDLKLDEGWMTTAEAGEVLDVARGQVAYLARTGWLPTPRRRVGKELCVRRSEVEALAAERARWVSYAQAATILGCSRTTVSGLVHQGRLEQRRADSISLASLSRASVERVKRARQDEAAEAASRRPPPPETGPPDAEHDWLTVPEAAELLGVTPHGVRWMAREERVPAMRRGGRWWLRRDQLQLVRNARVSQGGSIAASAHPSLAPSPSRT